MIDGDEASQSDSPEDPLLTRGIGMQSESASREESGLPHESTGSACGGEHPGSNTPGRGPGTATGTALARRLYLSHFLSTWSSRMFEFGAVLFLVSVFPETLLYTSVYALVRSLAVALLSSWLGSRIDRLNRLTTLRQSIGMSILYINMYSCSYMQTHLFLLHIHAMHRTDDMYQVWQRIPIAVSCVCFILLLSPENHGSSALGPFLFIVVVALACVEKLASVANTVSVERDWVGVLQFQIFI